jgi:Na+-driven multidrug efflux pump
MRRLPSWARIWAQAIPNAPAGSLAHRPLQHAFLGTVGVFFIVFATHRPAVYVDDPAVVPIAAMALRTFSCGNIGYAYGMVMLQAFNGAGDTLTPTIVNFFGFWVLEMPLAWWLAQSSRRRRR